MESSFFKNCKSDENSRNDFVSLIDLGSSTSLLIGETIMPDSSAFEVSPFLPNFDLTHLSSLLIKSSAVRTPRPLSLTPSFLPIPQTSCISVNSRRWCIPHFPITAILAEVFFALSEASLARVLLRLIPIVTGISTSSAMRFCNSRASLK